VDGVNPITNMLRKNDSVVKANMSVCTHMCYLHVWHDYHNNSESERLGCKIRHVCVYVRVLVICVIMVSKKTQL